MDFPREAGDDPDGRGLGAELQDVDAAGDQTLGGHDGGFRRDVTEVHDPVEAGVRQRLHFFFLARSASIFSTKPVSY